MSKNEMTVQIWTQPGISPRLSCAQKSSCLNTLLNTFLGTRKTKESSFCSKSCKSIAKSTQTVKFECLMLELLGGFEPPTSSLPSDKKPSGRWYIRLCGRFYRKKDEAGNSLLHVFRPLVSPCGSRCGSAPQAAPVWVNFCWQGNGHILRCWKQ